jgi:hypothetical protein
MLTVLQEKLADAHGLAMGASVVTGKVEERTLDRELRKRLWTMQEDAGRMRARCLEVERTFGEELAPELLARANTTNQRAAELASAWFKAGTGPLEAWSFLAMGEAGKVAVWTAVERLAARSEANGIAELASWALPLQQRHLKLAFEGMGRLADQADPHGPRYG